MSSFSGFGKVIKSRLACTKSLALFMWLAINRDFQLRSDFFDRSTYHHEETIKFVFFLAYQIILSFQTLNGFVDKTMIKLFYNKEGWNCDLSNYHYDEAYDFTQSQSKNKSHDLCQPPPPQSETGRRPILAFAWVRNWKFL